MSARKIPTFFLHSPPMIEIVGLPSGDHPEWVRRAWVGMSLPLAAHDLHRVETTSIKRDITSKWALRLARWLGRTKWTTGYFVNCSVAVDLLEAKDPKAAAWWRENAAHLLDGERWMVFEEPVCRVFRPPTPVPANT